MKSLSVIPRPVPKARSPCSPQRRCCRDEFWSIARIRQDQCVAADCVADAVGDERDSSSVAHLALPERNAGTGGNAGDVGEVDPAQPVNEVGDRIVARWRAVGGWLWGRTSFGPCFRFWTAAKAANNPTPLKTRPSSVTKSGRGCRSPAGVLPCAARPGAQDVSAEPARDCIATAIADDEVVARRSDKFVGLRAADDRDIAAGPGLPAGSVATT